MRLLILGHTAFLGRAIIDAACDRGYSTTVLGRTAPGFVRPLPGESGSGSVEVIEGTSEDILIRLAGRDFDAVIDLSAGNSMTTLRTALTLAGHVNFYILVSSTSVYRDFAAVDIDESYPVAMMPVGVEERLSDFSTYGARLALCEQRVAEALPDKTFICRPGLLTGPYDCTERVTRVLRRMAEGGEMFATGEAEQPIQLLDVRDLAGFLLDRAVAAVPGVVNAVGQSAPARDVLRAMADSIDATGTTFVFPGDDALARAGLQPMAQLPLWVPQRGYPGFFRVSGARARRLGLNPRPIADTISATWAYQKAMEQQGIHLHLPTGARPAIVPLTRSIELKILSDQKRGASTVAGSRSSSASTPVQTAA